MSRDPRSPLEPPARPLLLVLSGLSGAGKDAVLSGLRQTGLPLEFILTATTREKRPNERDGVHYRFIAEDRFREMIDRGELLEWAQVYGNLYGVPREPVSRALKKGRDVVVKVDVQGAATIKKALPQAVFIFLAPPSIEELVQRLRQRRTESEAELELRVKTAGEELQTLPMFDYLVINREGELERAVEDIEAIIAAEKHRVKPREISL